jgi:hypothetical protein
MSPKRDRFMVEFLAGHPRGGMTALAHPRRERNALARTRRCHYRSQRPLGTGIETVEEPRTSNMKRWEGWHSRRIAARLFAENGPLFHPIQALPL